MFLSCWCILIVLFTLVSHLKPVKVADWSQLERVFNRVSSDFGLVTRNSGALKKKFDELVRHCLDIDADR